MRAAHLRRQSDGSLHRLLARHDPLARHGTNDRRGLLARLGLIPHPASVLLSALLLSAIGSGAYAAAGAAPATKAAQPESVPVLVTVDDLPISSERLHPDPAERERITRELLAVLARHRVTAVGFVVWERVDSEADRHILQMWLDAGHELGNHTGGHADLTRLGRDEWIADAERGRAGLSAFLGSRGRTLRFFRYPYLRQGDTIEKAEGVRTWLAKTGQRPLPATVDPPDYSFEEAWVEARRAGDEHRLDVIGEDDRAATRLVWRRNEAIARELFGRAVPQVLLVHATEIGAAQWDSILSDIKASGGRFATADEVLSDPAFANDPIQVGHYGWTLWDTLLDGRRREEARAAVENLLRAQADAWSRGELETFTNVYADDAQFATPQGLTRGRVAVLDRYRSKYPDGAAMGRLTLDVLEYRPLAGHEVTLLGDSTPGRVHAASVLARWTLHREGRDDATGLTLLVLRRQGDTWKIVQDASM